MELNPHDAMLSISRLGDVVMPIEIPEGVARLLSDRVVYEIVYLCRRVRKVRGLPHVAFRLEPVPEIHTSEMDFDSSAIDNLRSGCLKKALCI